MSVSAANATYQGIAPTVTLEVLANERGGPAAQNLVAYATHTHDGSVVAGTVNWIDGTAVLPFTPSGVIAFRSGGDAATTTTVGQVANVSAITNKECVVNFVTAGANTKTTVVTLLIFK